VSPSPQCGDVAIAERDRRFESAPLQRRVSCEFAPHGFGVERAPDFARLFTIILIILAMVTMIDQFSAWLRRRLV
jgi:hypothetical protein